MIHVDIRKPLSSLCFFLLLCIVTGCESPTPQPLSADEILSSAVERTRGLKSFHFVIDCEGAFAYLTEDRSLAFGRAEGNFYTPDQVRATIRIISPGMITEMSMVALGDEYWETDLLSGEWRKLPSAGFNPATLLAPQSGFQEILLNDVSNLRFEGLQELPELPGQNLYTLSGMLGGDGLYSLSYGLIGPQPMAIRMWVDPQTFDVFRVQLDEPATSAETGPQGETTTIWQVDFWDFDQITPITPPPEN